MERLAHIPKRGYVIEIQTDSGEYVQISVGARPARFACSVPTKDLVTPAFVTPPASCVLFILERNTCASSTTYVELT